MVRTQNGFELAELDLAQRGPGEFFGTRQAGLPEFRVADLLRDRATLELAKVEAARFVESRDPALTDEEVSAVWTRLKQQWQRRYAPHRSLRLRSPPSTRTTSRQCGVEHSFFRLSSRRDLLLLSFLRYDIG